MPQERGSERPMNIDATHRLYLIGLLLLSVLTAGFYVAAPFDATPSSTQGLLFGGCGTLLVLFCALLPVRRKLQRLRRLAKWRVLRTAVWDKGHIYFGLFACLLLHLHAGFRTGGPL